MRKFYANYANILNLRFFCDKIIAYVGNKRGTKNLIESNPLALASVDQNGNPHCIAVAYVKVVSNNQILITDAHIIETVKNIKRNSKVSLVVWNKNWEEDCFGYILKGFAEHFTNGKWYQKVSEIAENEGLEYKGAILITIDKTRKIV